MGGIGWYVHHHGSGHLRRMQAVVAHLRAPVTVLSSVARPAGMALPWVRLPLDAGAGPAADPTANGELHWAPLGQPGLRDRMATISAWIAATEPATIVVDASVEVALLARLHGVPVVVLAAPGHRDDRAHRLGYGAATLLLAPWPAWARPLTPEQPAGGPAAVGAFSLLDAALLAAHGPADAGDGRRVLLLAGAGGADHGPDEVVAAARACPGTSWTVLGLTAPDLRGVCFRGPVAAAEVTAELLRADVVVVHAGQNAVAEVAAARRPAVVLAQERPFGEQRATVRVLAAAGLAATADGWPAPAAWPGLLHGAGELGGDGWARWSDGHGAARAAARIDALVDGPAA